MHNRTARAVWKGGLKDGSGHVGTERGALREVPYNFSGRFEEGTTGTNPEELIGAALAGCYSMALSGELGRAALSPESLETKATVRLEKKEAGWTVVGIHLDVTGRVPGTDQAAFAAAAEKTKAGCPISRLLSPGTAITLTAKLA